MDDTVRHPIRLPAVLTDGVVRLDEHRLEDAAADLAGEDAIRRHIARRAAGGPEVTYALRLADGTLIGGVEFPRPATACANVGYWVFAAFRGHGYARRGLELICQAAIRGVGGLAEITAHIEADNIASLRTAAAAGFVQAGSVSENGVERLRFVRRV